MADEHPIGADDVARKQFATAFRGFDQYEVRAFLAQVAAELASLHERERALRDRLTIAEDKPAPRHVEEDELEAALGVETTRVLHAAREAATEIRSKAEESVARLLREANDESTRLRSEAETILARRTEEAEGEAAAIVAAAEEAAATLRAEAESAAAEAVAAAQQEGREMLGEAQAVRERVLKDLSRRRKAAGAQLEQLLAGRERLLAAYDVVRGTLDEATGALTVAEAEARAAAEAAGLRSAAEEEPDAAPAEPDGEREPEPEAPVAEAAPVDETPAVDLTAVEESQSEPAPEPDLPVRSVAMVPPLTGSAEVAPLEDRRSSSLRLLRRRIEPVELPALDDEVEGVRLLRTDVAPAPGPVVVPDAPEPAAVTAPPPDVAAEPEAEPEVVEEALAEPVVEPEPEAAVEADPAPEVEPEPAERPVDDLFARLRADREAAVAKAEEVLAQAEVASEQPAPVTDAEPDAEPEPEVVETVAAADSVFEARDAAVEAAERSLTRTLKRALADEQNEVLDNLRRLRGAPTLAVLLPAADEHAFRVAAAAAEQLHVGAAAGAAAFEGQPPSVDELAGSLAAELTEDVRARLERALDANSGDEETLVEAISATYREWKTSRSEPLARHHVAAAYAFGAFTAAPAERLVWVVDAAEGGCADCDDNALAGPTRKGLVFPTGQVHPPAHAGCRCLVLPAT